MCLRHVKGLKWSLRDVKGLKWSLRDVSACYQFNVSRRETILTI